MITINHLVKKYNQHTAVDDLTFHVEKGQIYGFLGPNGAGKSTTMNILTGYLAASSGEVLICGHDILKEPEEAKKHIGYLPEQPPLYLDMTVLEYLNFVAELKGIEKREKNIQINEIMEMTKIGEVKNRLIKNLSKGYRQRVGLAQAIVGYPDIIVLDEPTVGLDPKQIIEIRELIKKLGENHTVILSSHILSEVSAICDMIMIISRGKLVGWDTAEGLIQMLNQGTETIAIVKGNKEKVIEVLKKIDKINSYRIEETQNKDLLKVILDSDVNVDIREELTFALAENRIAVMELKVNEKTLEDIFLELTGDKEAINKSRESKKKMKKLFHPKTKNKKEQYDEITQEETEEVSNAGNL